MAKASIKSKGASKVSQKAGNSKKAASNVSPKVSSVPKGTTKPTAVTSAVKAAKKPDPKMTPGMRPNERNESGCNGTIEVKKCRCSLVYTKLDAIDDAGMRHYNRSHLTETGERVDPSYANGRYMCDGCGSFFDNDSPLQNLRSNKKLPDGLQQLSGYAFHCKHGYDFCCICHL